MKNENKKDPTEFRHPYPQGAFGVDEMNLDQLQDEIHELGRSEANNETSTKYIDKVNELNARSPYIKILVTATLVLVCIAALISYNIDKLPQHFFHTATAFISDVFTLNLTTYILIGIIVQLLDGALGMGYGVSCSSFLLGLGLTPAYTSATVHLAKSFNTGVSGVLHLRFYNLNQKIFRSLLIPGIIGSVLGAWLLADVINNDFVKPFIAAYLLILGVLITIKPFKVVTEKKRSRRISWLAIIGGFVDSIGGGGWGPIVTSNLLRKKQVNNYSVGSVNLVEFFVAMSAALTFIYFGNFSGWQAILGLIIGGVIAYPYTAIVASKINKKATALLLGIIVLGFSIHIFMTSDYTLVKKLFDPLF